MNNKKGKKIIPCFFDKDGTMNLLIEDGEHALDNIRDYITETKKLSKKFSDMDPEFDYEIRTYIISGSPCSKALASVIPFYQAARNEGNSVLFSGVVAEYCGFYVEFNQDIPMDKEVTVGDTTCYSIQPLMKNLPELEAKRQKIDEIIKNYDKSAKVNPDVQSMLTVEFSQDVPKGNFDAAYGEIEQLLGKEMIDSLKVNIYFDEYGNEMHFASKENNKAQAVVKMLDFLKQKDCEIPFVVMGGDDMSADLVMYTDTHEELEKLGAEAAFLAPSNIGKIDPEIAKDPHIIVANQPNVKGIIAAMSKLGEKLVRRTNEKGEPEWEVK